MTQLFDTLELDQPVSELAAAVHAYLNGQADAHVHKILLREAATPPENESVLKRRQSELSERKLLA